MLENSSNSTSPSHTILVTAYAINPYKGSENGMGWNFVSQIAKRYRAIVITRENNLPQINKWIAEKPEPHLKNIHFVGYDLPPWQRFWKKTEWAALIYYYLWQRTLPAFIRRQNYSFDLVHNLNFHNDWTPSFLWTLGKPFIWGPVGHHEPIPHSLLNQTYSVSTAWKEKVKWWIKQTFWKSSRSLKDTVNHANLVLAMNSSVSQVLPIEDKSFQILPSVGASALPELPECKSELFEVLSIGRFVPLKGFDISIAAFARFYHQLDPKDKSKCRLTLIGKGPLESQIKLWLSKNRLDDVAKLINWIPHEEVLKLYQHASVFLFPSYEGAGMVVGEALSSGLPVICWDNSGPGELIDDCSGIRILYQSYEESVSAFASALKLCYQNPQLLKEYAVGARKRFQTHLDWNQKGEQLHQAYQKLLN